MVTYTTTYNFAKPTVGDDEDVWGGYLNGNFDTLESLLKGTTALTSLSLTGTFTIDNTTQTSFNVEYANDGAGIGPILRTYRDSASPAVADALGGIDFKGNNSAGSEKFYARIKGVIIDPADTTEDGAVEISVAKAGNAAWETSGLVAKFDPNGMELRGDLRFEGSTANNAETTLTVTDPTADRTITLPDASGTVALTGATQNVSFGTLNVSGDINVGSQTGTWVTSDQMSDSIGWNSLHGVYIGSDVSGSNEYIYGDGTIRTGGAYYDLWHAGNDGAGSGLDADTLDGQEGSYYTNAANLTGTIPDVFSASTRYNIGLIDGYGANTRDKLRVWNGSNYTIGMSSGYTFGALGNDYAMSFQMNDDNERGFWWGDTGHTNAQGAMSLTTQGHLTVANSVKIGYGESDTSGASYDLDVSGDAAVNNIYLSNAIYHAEDTDTYFQFHNTSNQARIVCNGSEVMEWGNNYAKMNDWDSLYLGSGSDFRLYHDGTNNYIRNMNHAAGDIYIQGEDTSGTNHTIAAFYSSNSAPYVGLRYDNVEVFTTVSGGVNINGNLNAVDNIYLAGTLYHEGDTNTFLSFGTDSVAIGAGGSQEVTVTAAGVQLGDSGNGYFQPVTGSYGSIQIDGGAHNGYEGYSIGGVAVFMTNSTTVAGLYNDANNHWWMRGTFNGTTEIHYQGVSKLDTLSTGVSINGSLFTDGSNKEDYDALSGTTPTCNTASAGAFSLTLSGNTTFTFSNTDAGSGWSQGFVLELTGHASSTYTVTWPTSVEWAGGTAPDAPAAGETDIYVFWTRDGGTTWYGVQSIDAAS